jgi:hypothetical protein
MPFDTVIVLRSSFFRTIQIAVFENERDRGEGTDNARSRQVDAHTRLFGRTIPHRNDEQNERDKYSGIHRRDSLKAEQWRD